MRKPARIDGMYIIVTPVGRVVRWQRDGPTSRLAWCETHAEPLWVYADGSYDCPHDLILGVHLDVHEIVDAPWEHP